MFEMLQISQFFEETWGIYAEKEYNDYQADNFDEFIDSVSHPFGDIEDKTIRIWPREKAIEEFFD